MNETVQNILAAYKKKFGDLHTASDIGAVEILPTGFRELDDYVLGIGGFPRGRIVELFGQESSGKSALCQALVAKTQKDGGICVWLDAEGVLDVEWMKKFGIDSENLIFPEFEFGEEALLQVQYLIRDVDLIVIDSLAQLIPRIMYQRDANKDAKIAARASMVTQFLLDLIGGTKYNPKLRDTRCCVVFINQLRAKFNVAYGERESTPGGWALRHNASVRLEVKRIQVKKEEERQRIRLRCKKSKIGPPFRECEMWLNWKGGFDEDESSLLSMALEKNLVEITERGGWISSEHMSRRVQGVKKFVEYCEENPEFRKLVEGE